MPYTPIMSHHNNVGKYKKRVSKTRKSSSFKKYKKYNNRSLTQKQKQKHNKSKRIKKTTSGKKRKNTNQHTKQIKKYPIYVQKGKGRDDSAKCDPKKLDDLLAGNPPAMMDQEMPNQTITAKDVSGYNMKGLGKSPGPPPSLPSGCIIL